MGMRRYSSFLLSIFVVVLMLFHYVETSLIDSDGTFLYGSNRSLTELPSLPFTLTTIFLDNNKIREISNTDLSNLTNLYNLYLSKNLISTIDRGAFKDLKNLRICDLSYNSIVSLSEDLFRNMPFLRILQLQRNRLTTLPRSIFQGLTALMELQLSFNSFRNFERGLFDDLLSFNDIRIHTNNFVCDCYLEYLVTWVKTVMQFRQLGAGLLFCNDSTTALVTLPDDYFDSCKEMENGALCDGSSLWCKNSSICINGICGCRSGFYDDNGNATGGVCREVYEVPTEIWIIVAVGGTFLISTSVFLLHICRKKAQKRSKLRKKKIKKSEIIQNLMKSLKQHMDITEEDSRYVDLKSIVIKPTQPRLRMKRNDFDEYQSISQLSDPTKRPLDISIVQNNQLMEKWISTVLPDEWEKLKELTQRYPFEEAVSEKNKFKNRDMGCIPYDMNRVKLDIGEDDYINASYISGCWSVIDYISTQSPMQNTVLHFMHMIWEQDVKIIINLSGYQDEDEEQDHADIKYWANEQDATVKFGLYSVQTKMIVKAGKTVIRRLRITRKKESRVVTQCHLLEWTSFNTEVCSTLVDFVQLVWKNVEEKEEIESKIVHCSTGSGRTGVFIALDMLLQDLVSESSNGNIDIFDLTLGMRNQRPRIIEEECQYLFLHECIRFFLEEKAKASQREVVENKKIRDYLEF